MAFLRSHLLRCATSQYMKFTFFKSQNIFENHTSSSSTYELSETNNLQYYVDFKKLLRKRDIKYKDGYTCLKVKCELCVNDGNRLAYVNKHNGSFICPNCDIQFPVSDVLKAYNNKRYLVDMTAATTVVKKDTEHYENERLRRASVPSHICENLRIKGLKLIDFVLLEASYCNEKNSLILPLRNVNNRQVGELWHHVTTSEDECYQNSTLSGLLVHMPVKIKTTKAIIVSNTLDFCTLLAQRLKAYSIVCLPYGLKALPQECLPALDQYDELILWFKYDSTSWGVAKTFANKLDEQRCLLIKPTATEPPPFEAQCKRFNLRQILARATPLRHDSIITFKNLRSGILSELQNIEKVNGVKWKRFPILNKLLKGHRKGELTILTGPTGCGKTTFISEYSLDLALQGVSTLWGSFEISNTRLAITLLRQFVGQPLEKRLSDFHQLATKFENFPIYFMTFHGQQPLKLVLETIEHAHYVHDINHVIIDNLHFMMGIPTINSRMDKFWEQDNIVAGFRSLATKRNIHVTLVMHPRKERDDDTLTASSIFGSAKATQEADNVLIIQDKRLTNLHGKKYLQVAKNRYNGNLGIMSLDFNKEALSYAQVAPKLRKGEKIHKNQLT